MPSPFPCSPVVCECSLKKKQIEKKKWFAKYPVYGSFIGCPGSWDVFFTLSSHSNVVCYNKLVPRLVCIMISSSRMLYYSTFLVISKKNCDLTLTHKDLVMISRDAVTARHETLIMWYNDTTQGQFTWKWIYLPNFSGLAWTRSFKITPNDMSTCTSTSCLEGYDHRA